MNFFQKYCMELADSWHRDRESFTVMILATVFFVALATGFLALVVMGFMSSFVVTSLVLLGIFCFVGILVVLTKYGKKFTNN